MEYEYKLYVGHGDTQEVAEVVKDYADGATLNPGLGIWKGTVEPSTVVTILSPLDNDRNIIHWLAERLRDEFGQDCVLVTKMKVDRYTV